MNGIAAQFRPRWRPGRPLLAALAALVAISLAASALAMREHQRVLALRAQLAQIAAAGRTPRAAAAPPPSPAYDASARLFLRERSANWASMLRTLESGAMPGVTPSSLEFDAADGLAQVHLDYADSAALLDYLGRINEGVSPGSGLSRWTLVETRLHPAATPDMAPSLPGTHQAAGALSSATIRSTWQEQAPASGAAP